MPDEEYDPSRLTHRRTTVTTAPVDFFSPEIIADPYPALRRLREEEPVHWNGRLGAWVLTRYEDVSLGLRDERFSADRIRPFLDAQSHLDPPLYAALGNSVRLWAVFNDPPMHTRLRRLLNRGFSPSAVQALRGNIEAIARELIDGVAERGAMDLIADFGNPLPAIVIADMLGVPREDVERLKRWSDDIAAFVLVSRAQPDRYRVAAASLMEMEAYFGRIVAKRRARPGDKIIDGLIAAHEGEDSLTLEELIASCVLLLFAGHETTTYFIANGMLALLQHPAELAALRAIGTQEAALNTALNELLRWDGPIISTVRVLLDDVPLHGKTLRRGERVFLFVNSANRDPRVFDQPDRLDLGREEARRHLTFGHGIHTCLGAHLARVEGAVAFPMLLERFPRIALERRNIEWSDSLVIRGLRSLPICFRT